MPPAIPDSDDEGDDIGALEREDVVSSARGSRGSGGEVKGALDGADERSTGSTEDLRRRIQSAERGLLANSAPVMDQQNSSASPARQAAKRRHTAAFSSEANTSPQKGVKRTKTLKTYGASRRQLEPADDNEFNQFRDDLAHAAAGTSQSVRFSDHSGHQSSLPLPTGSVQTDFIDHEPAMFKDTGDTVADASSEQQRQIEQALASKKAFSTSMTKDAQQEQQSSSIPWTASDIADSARSKKSERTSNNAQGACDDADQHADPNNPPVPQTDLPAEKPEPAENAEPPSPAASHAELHSNNQDQVAKLKPKSSPMVEIPRQKPETVVIEDTGPQKRRSSKGRNKKVEEERSEPLNSDDRAIGLPKERYKPRPSRRRAIQVVEEPIDYSVAPEKAAKVKRTKTTGAKTVASTAPIVPDALQNLAPGVSPPGLSKDGKSGDERKDEGSVSKPTSPKPEEDESPVKRRRTIKQQDPDPQPDLNAPIKVQSVSPVKLQPGSRTNEDDMFVKPAIPTPKPKSSSRTKRAQTTIFEDHVLSQGSRRSPNLSQQQAKRKSALDDVQNEAVAKPQRKRKSVVADDSDDEDELAREDDAVVAKAASPPKKRRGRPPKATNSAPKDSEEQGEEDEEQAAPDQLEVEEPPKKRGRGRPAEAASNIHEADAPLPDPQPASTPSKPGAAATEIPTPSPEKPAEKTTPTPQKAAASSTTQHSPIKSNSKMPLRVGLSKRSRIQPLLRMMKPPKR